MSDRLALTDLLDRVKSDAIRDSGSDNFAALNSGGGVYIDPQAAMARDAHWGCLKSAYELHNALVPDEGWEIFRTAKYPGMIPGSSQFPYRAYVGWSRGYSGEADNPARAWLIAIIQTLIATKKGEPHAG